MATYQEMLNNLKSSQSDKPKKEEEKGYTGIGSSVVNFGKDIGQSAYLMFGGQKKIDKITQQYMDSGDKFLQLAQKQTDPEKKKKMLLQAQEMYDQVEGVSESITGKLRSNKQIIGDALGTLGWLTAVGTPTFLGGALKAGGMGAKLGAQKAVSSIAGRIVAGTATGAGIGAQQALKEDKSWGEVGKETAIGAGTGLALGAAMEGLAFGLRKLAQTKPVKNFIGNIYNRELQPQNQDLVKSLERHAETIGQKVANSTDEFGKPIYKGGYDTMAKQAEQQISKNESLLLEDLKKFNNAKIDRSLFSKDLMSKLEDTFGSLDNSQKAIVGNELKKLPQSMNPTELLKQRQIIDTKIPKGFWIEPNPQKAFIGNVRYYLRGLMKNGIEQFAPTVAVKQLNQKIGLAIDVRDLSYLQEALRMKGKPGGFFIGSMIGRLLDRTIFNPKIRTRVAQGVRQMGQGAGNILMRNIGTQIGTKDIQNYLNQ